jgi:hypothetical protein
VRRSGLASVGVGVAIGNLPLHSLYSSVYCSVCVCVRKLNNRGGFETRERANPAKYSSGSERGYYSRKIHTVSSATYSSCRVLRLRATRTVGPDHNLILFYNRLLPHLAHTSGTTVAVKWRREKKVSYAIFFYFILLCLTVQYIPTAHWQSHWVPTSICINGHAMPLHQGLGSQDLCPPDPANSPTEWVQYKKKGNVCFDVGVFHVWGWGWGRWVNLVEGHERRIVRQVIVIFEYSYGQDRHRSSERRRGRERVAPGRLGRLDAHGRHAWMKVMMLDARR